MIRDNLVVISSILAAMLSCILSDDVRLGNDASVQCPDTGVPSADIITISLIHSAPHLSQDETVILYSNSTRSTGKYSLELNLRTVVVRDVVVSDEGEYNCQVTYQEGNGTDSMSTDTTLNVYGE